MTKLRISCKHNAFNIKIAQEKTKVGNNNVNLTQTNIINTDSMIFTSNYIYNNLEVVAAFLNGLSIQKNISKLVVDSQDIALLMLLVLQHVKTVSEFEIKNEEDMTYEVYERLLFSPNIKKVICYNVKSFMIEQLDKRNIDVILKREIFFVSKFMEDNTLSTYSSIFYKRSIVIKCALENDDLTDFEVFCKANKHLKVIDLFYYSKENVRQIINVLARCKKKNIRINLIQSDENINDIIASINYLKSVQDKVKDKYKYKLNIVYSNDYKQKNLWSQLTINNIKLCCAIVILMIIFSIALIQYNSYQAYKSIDEINSLIKTEIDEISNNHVVGNSSNIPDDSSNIGDDSSSSEEPIIKAYQEIFNTLEEKNSDTVGYLKVFNTTIDYPVVKTNDNKYYLNNNFNKKKNSFGWIFMDYRNNEKDLNQNTIIYGHNSRQKIVFGTLINVLKESWYKNPENHIITFHTKYYLMEWEVFSVYKVGVTSDYLVPSFESLTEYQNFITLISERSAYDFGVDVTIDDKILTLSTCVDGIKNRAVLHAKLITQKALE